MDKSIEQILEDHEYKELVRSKAGLYFILGADRDDLIQEGMIGLVKAYNSFDETKGKSFKAYATTVVQNEIINAVVNANRKKYSPLNTSVEIPNTLLAGKASSPEDALIYEDFWAELTENKNKLFGKLEHSVLLKLMDGKTYKEIADELGKTPKQIDNAMQRIKAKVREL